MATTKNLYFRRIEAGDAYILQSFSQKLTKQAPAVLGKTFSENRILANAYATDNGDYPVADLIYSKVSREPIGLVIAKSADRGASIDVSIVVGDLESYLEVLIYVVENTNVKHLYLTPNMCNVDKVLAFFSRSEVIIENNSSTPEFKLNI